MMRTVICAFVLLTILAACGERTPSYPQREPPPGFLENLANRAAGNALFHEHCAQCHGPEAQGHPDWRNPKVVAAPPLNGTGNEWKRRKQDMIAVIKNGAKRNGEPVMPAWKGRLTDREIEDIINWYQALWPADVYERWRKANVPESVPSG